MIKRDVAYSEEFDGMGEWKRRDVVEFSQRK